MTWTLQASWTSFHLDRVEIEPPRQFRVACAQSFRQGLGQRSAVNEACSWPNAEMLINFFQVYDLSRTAPSPDIYMAPVRTSVHDDRVCCMLVSFGSVFEMSGNLCLQITPQQYDPKLHSRGSRCALADGCHP